ncbi:Uncharacterized protein Fot_54757 [Forsythia ovata]|uniref:Uncharacterized protein n=1 Tax=Forsythia ovata TaxID=205694 RepID=A0ABD1P6K3_9LAMI
MLTQNCSPRLGTQIEEEAAEEKTTGLRDPARSSARLRTQNGSPRPGTQVLKKKLPKKNPPEKTIVCRAVPVDPRRRPARPRADHRIIGLPLGCADSVICATRSVLGRADLQFRWLMIEWRRLVVGGDFPTRAMPDENFWPG